LQVKSLQPQTQKQLICEGIKRHKKRRAQKASKVNEGKEIAKAGKEEKQIFLSPK
jgi:hypothetical protein